MEELQKRGKFAGDIVNVVGAPVSIVVRAGAPKPGSKSAEAVKALIKFLTGPEAAPRLKANGFEPG